MLHGGEAEDNEHVGVQRPNGGVGTRCSKHASIREAHVLVSMFARHLKVAAGARLVRTCQTPATRRMAGGNVYQLRAGELNITRHSLRRSIFSVVSPGHA